MYTIYSLSEGGILTTIKLAIHVQLILSVTPEEPVIHLPVSSTLDAKDLKREFDEIKLKDRKADLINRSNCSQKPRTFTRLYAACI